MEYVSAVPGSGAFEDAWDLFAASFPPRELMPMDGLPEGSTIECAYGDGRLMGACCYLDGRELRFLLYLAVSPDVRGSGVGTTILGRLVSSGPAVVLNAEAVDPDLPGADARIRRIRFYEHRGFRRTGLEQTDAHGRFEILASGDFSMEDYRALLEVFGDFSVHPLGSSVGGIRRSP